MRGSGTDFAAALPLALLAACASASRAPRPLAPSAAFPVDSQTTRVVAPGVVQRSLYAARGPWAIHLLDVDTRACWTLEARKAGGGAVGRTGTLALARDLSSTGREVVGAVNGDFFSLVAPQGVTQGLHVERGAVVTGPNAKPSVAIDSLGAPRIDTFAAYGTLARGRDTMPIVAWNRASGDAAGTALYDDAYGARTDSAPGRVFAHLAMRDARRATIARLDTGTSTTIARGERVLAITLSRDTARRDVALTVGDSVSVDVALAPWFPRAAVTGRGWLLRGGAITSDVASEGSVSFRARNPRTAIGIAPRGRVLLVVVDGRQKPYSDGMTLRELAELFRSLGATDAVNLDGGGSSTLVVREASGALGIVNRPSDKGGERPVGNALAVVHGCAPNGS